MSRSRPVPSAVRLEVLEQRILLTADLPVSHTTDWQTSPSVQSAPANLSSENDAESTPTPWVIERSEPLQLRWPSGSLMDLQAAEQAGQTLQLYSGLTLIGTGQWDGPLVNDGVVAPGESPGVLQVQSFEQSAAGVLQLEMGGSRPGAGQSEALDGHDQVMVSGQARLNGLLSLDFINDFRPTAGQVFDVMTWSSRQGTFSAYSGLYAGNGVYLKPVYESDRLKLVATALPGLAQLSLADVPQAQQALDQWLTQLANQVAQPSVSLEASLEVAGMRLSGQWQVSVGILAGNQVETTLTASRVSAQWSVPGLVGSINNVSGSLVMGGHDLRLNLKGNGVLAVGNGPSMAGDFTLTYDPKSGNMAVTALGVNMQLGESSRGPALALSGGRLSLTSGAGLYGLEVVGTGALQAIEGVAFDGTLRYRAGSQIPMARFEAQDATVQLGSLGSVRGDLVFASESVVAEGRTVQELRLGVLLDSATLNMGLISLSASAGALGVIWRTSTPETGLGQAIHQTIMHGVLDVSLVLDATVQLSGQRVRLSYNPGEQALLRSVDMPDGSALVMDLVAGALQLSGRFVAQVQGLARFEGNFSLDVQKKVRLLSNGQAVELTEYALAGSRASMSFLPGGSDQTGLGALDADLALVYAKDAFGNSWLSSRGVAGSMVVAGYALDQLDSAQWSINRAVTLSSALAGVTVDWSDARRFVLGTGRQLLLDQVGDVFTLPIQGRIALGDNSLSGQLNFSHDRMANSWQLTVANAQWLLAAGPAFVRLNQVSGQLRIDSERRRIGELNGQVDIGGIAGLSLTASAARVAFNDPAGSYTVSLTGASLAIDGFGQISGNLSVSRQNSAAGERLLVAGTALSATIGAAGAQVLVSNARMGLLLSVDALGQGGFALVAQGGVSLSAASNAFTLSAQQARVEVNRLGTSLNETLTLGDGSTVSMVFDDERARSAVRISGGTLQLGSWGSVSGDLRVDSQVVTIGAIQRQQLEIGVENLSASLDLGGPAVALSGGSAAVLLFSETVDNQSQLRYALQAQGQAALTGVSGLTLNAQRMQVSVNRTGAAIDHSIATPAGWLQMAQMDGQTRLSGYASVGLGSWFNTEGEVFLESRQNQNVTLSDGSIANVNMLLLGGSGLSASLSAGADLSLGDVNLAMVLSNETGTSARRWITGSATIGSASVDALAKAQIEMGMLDLNRQLNSDGSLYLFNDEKVINWRPTETSVGLPLVINDTNALVIDSQVARLATAIKGRLDIGGGSIEGVFHIAEAAIMVNGQPQPAWAVVAGQASVALSANGASAKLENVTGNLLIAANGVSGTLSGNGSITGIDGVSASGSLVASFANHRLQLAGSLEMAVAGVGQLSGNFAVIKEPTVFSVPEFERRTATLGSAGTSLEAVAGGQVTTARVQLSLSDASGKLTREGLYTLSWGGQNQSFDTLDGVGRAARPVSDDELATRIQAALERLAVVGQGNVRVTGSRSDGFALEFMGALAGKPVALASAPGDAGLWLSQPPDPADRDDWGVIEETAAMQMARSEAQQLTLARSSGSGQTFTLALGQAVTAPIAFNSAGAVVNEIQLLTLTAANRAAGLLRPAGPAHHLPAQPDQADQPGQHGRAGRQAARLGASRGRLTRVQT